MKKKFTLIELIIVIVVIGILAAMALPKFNGVVRNARLSAMINDKEVLEKEARENNYSGKIIRKRGGRKKSKIYIIYDYGNKKPYNKGTKIKIKVKG